MHRLSCSVAWEIFLDQHWTCVSCTGRRILYHWPTKETAREALFLPSSAKIAKYTSSFFWALPLMVICWVVKCNCNTNQCSVSEICAWGGKKRRNLSGQYFETGRLFCHWSSLHPKLFLIHGKRRNFTQILSSGKISYLSALCYLVSSLSIPSYKWPCFLYLRDLEKWYW